MTRPMCLFLVLAVALLPRLAMAEVQPHRAEYSLRLGAAPSAPRIGTAVQELTQDCSGWRLRRDITTEIALTTAWKISVASKLDGEESKGGNMFRYRTVQIQNGTEREIKGRVQRTGKEVRADIVSSAAPAQLTLPTATMMPVASMAHLVERLSAGAASFPALAFDAEVIGDVFLIDVTQLDSIRAGRSADAVQPTGKSWPVSMSFTRGRQQDQRPLFTVTALAFDTGVLDRLTVDTGLVSVAADLLSLKMQNAPVCPRS